MYGYVVSKNVPLKLCNECYVCCTVDIRCNGLTSPANGRISCSSGRDGVGYERDTCGFTCNNGYVLTGNATRTCLSNGSWSGIDAICRRGMYICVAAT